MRQRRSCRNGWGRGDRDTLWLSLAGKDAGPEGGQFSRRVGAELQACRMALLWGPSSPNVQGLDHYPPCCPPISSPSFHPGLPGPLGKVPGGCAVPAWERQLCRPPACRKGLTGTATVCWGHLAPRICPPFSSLTSCCPGSSLLCLKACSYSVFSALV